MSRIEFECVGKVRARCSCMQMTHPGNRREANQDSSLVAPDVGLCAVADGLGGHCGGEYASAVALSSLIHACRAHASLLDAFELAHQAILDAASSGFGAPGMGSTLVAAQFAGERFQVAWAGDSRAYLWNGSLTPLTRDHTLGRQLRDAGADPARSGMAKALYKSLGSPSEAVVQAEAVLGKWAPGDSLLLCSDGLTDELCDQSIARVFAQTRLLEERVALLLEHALSRGGRDNITLLLVTLIEVS